MNILIVDDELAVRLFFRSVLAEQGYTITDVARARHALTLLRDGAFELVILDLSLSDSDGVELISHLRAEFPHLKVVAVSGFMGRTLRNAATTAGAAATLGKPTTPNQLQCAVSQALGRSFA